MLPASLLAAVESHACFTGCYTPDTSAVICADAAHPLVLSFYAGCQDCLTFKVGSLANLLPFGMSHHGLAQELSAHMRAVRGYRWAISGYHNTGQGFWLSAAYYGDGLFLVDGSRNHGSGGQDVDLLVQAFRSKLVQPDDQGMLDPALYSSEVVHLSCSTPLGAVRTKQHILRNPQCSLSPRQGLRRVCIVEFLPLTTKVSSSSATNSVLWQSPTKSVVTLWPSPAKSVAKLALKIGDTCTVCNAEVKERQLFTGTFVGCLC